MQAIRVERKRSTDARWVQHLSLLAAVAFLFSWVTALRSPVTAELVERLPIGLLGPPSTSSQDWRPIKVPARTAAQRETWDDSVQAVQPAAELPAGALNASVAATAGDGAQWVQAHRRAPLRTAPEPGAVPELEVPQWSYLQVVDTMPGGWVRVNYGSDGAGRPSSVAWISAHDIGVSGPPPRFVTSVRDTTLWSADAPDAVGLTVVPRLAPLELAGPERNGRVAVRVSDGAGAAPSLAWVDWEAVQGSLAPAELELPLARAFSPFADNVRLDVPHRTQLDGSLSAMANCGPTSVSMVLGAFGIGISTGQARALAMRSMGIYSPWSGTTLDSLRDVAEAYGLRGLELRENGRYKRWSLDDVRRHLRAGHPVIPQLRYRLIAGNEWSWAGFDHYVVLTGLDGDDFLFNDPARVGANGKGRLTSGQLLRAWMGSDHPGAAFAIARPI